MEIILLVFHGETALTLATWSCTVVTAIVAHRSLPPHRRHWLRNRVRAVRVRRITRATQQAQRVQEIAPDTEK